MSSVGKESSVGNLSSVGQLSVGNLSQGTIEEKPTATTETFQNPLGYRLVAISLYLVTFTLLHDWFPTSSTGLFQPRPHLGTRKFV